MPEFGRRPPHRSMLRVPSGASVAGRSACGIDVTTQVVGASRSLKNVCFCPSELSLT